MPSVATAAHLLASHFTGNIYPLTLTEAGDLTVGSGVRSGNFWPSWLTLDSESKTVYVPDGAFWAPPNGLTTFSIDDNGSLAPPASSTFTEGGEVHSSLYGGQDGKGFIGLAY